MKKILNLINYMAIILIVVCTLALLLHNFIPSDIVRILPIIIGTMLLLVLLILAIRQLFSKTMIHKLMALPLLLTTVFIGYMFIKMPIYPLLMNALIHEDYTIHSDDMFDSMRLGFKFFNIGIWLAVIPIFIAAFIMIRRTKASDIDLSSYDLVKAKIVKGEYTDITINGIRVYRLNLEIFHPEGNIQVAKDLTIPYPHFEEGSDIMVYLKDKKVYLKIEDEIY